MKAKKFDVVIIGAGITGLLLQYKLLEIGCRVLLIEKNAELAKGPSTKCEGILHRGLYHGYAIDNLEEAISVARKCNYGYEQILSKYPQVVEEMLLETVAIIQDKANTSKATERWDKAGVWYETISYEHAQRILADAKLSEDYGFFKAKEKSINTRLLLHLIQNQIKGSPNAEILNGVTDIKFIDKNSLAAIMTNGEYEIVESDFIVYASGKGTKAIFEREHKINLPIKIFKAHLLTTSRLCKNNIYCLDEGQVTIFHHSDKTIVGMTKYNKECTEDDIEIDPEAVDELLSKTSKYLDIQGAYIKPYWCHKVDYGQNGLYHSLDAQLHEPIRNHFVALPGKLTEAPWICDHLVREIFTRMNRSDIAQRPCDNFFEPLKNKV